ncbi:hypothetical protein KAV47_07255 [Candidatus Bathyarchaeota archaeon]|nr:hypothetical protein [Candidatus Bathyarchaeota archaeon]
MEKIPYLRSLKAVSDGAANFFLVTEPMPSSMWLFVQNTVEENRTANFDAVRVGRGKDIHEPHWWEEHVTCLVNVLYWQDKELHFVNEGERVIFRFDGTAAGDRLFCEVEGYVVEKRISGRPFRPRKGE